MTQIEVFWYAATFLSALGLALYFVRLVLLGMATGDIEADVNVRWLDWALPLRVGFFVDDFAPEAISNQLTVHAGPFVFHVEWWATGRGDE